MLIKHKIHEGYYGRRFTIHEMSLMWEVLQIVSNDAKLNGFSKVTKIEVIVGELSNVLPEALEYAFSYFQNDGLNMVNQGTELYIIREKVKVECQSCLFVFEPDYHIALCPKCELLKCILISGETFRVESYEGSEDYES